MSARRSSRGPGKYVLACLSSLVFHFLVIVILLCILGPSHAVVSVAPDPIIAEVAAAEKADPLIINVEVSPLPIEPLNAAHSDAAVEAEVEAFGLVDLWAKPGAIGTDPPAEVLHPAPPAFAGDGGFERAPPDGIGDPIMKLNPGSPEGRRSAATRKLLLEKGGGNSETEAAVSRGLKWIVRQQEPNGSWRLDGNFKDRGVSNDTAATAFGLLPLLGSGYTHKKAGPDMVNPFDKPIERALIWLLKTQNQRTGDLGGGMYAHALATIALCEAYSLSQDPLLRRPAQMAINYLVRAQHDAGGWRYAPGQSGDTSVTGWAVMALKSGQMAGLSVPDVTMRKASNFLNAANNQQDEGYGYTPSGGSTPTMSAVGLLCRQYVEGWGPRNIRMIKGVDNFLKKNPPDKNTDNIYYTYYATQVMHHFGGMSWNDWNERMRTTLLKGQDSEGSWRAAQDRHGKAGGQLMTTSLSVLTLEVYYRHLPLYYREAGER